MSTQGDPQFSLASSTQPLGADDAKLRKSLSSSASVCEMYKLNAIFFGILFQFTLNVFLYKPIIFVVAWHQITDNFRRVHNGEVIIWNFILLGPLEELLPNPVSKTWSKVSD